MSFKTFLLLLFFCPLFFIGQIQNPVSWTASYTEINEEEGEISITANIEAKWHIYSQKPSTAGPIPTTFTFTPTKNYELKNKTEEENVKEEFDKAFDTKLFIFTEKAVFKQKIKRVNKAKFSASIKLEYMSCNDMMCLPPKIVELSINVPAVVIKK